jgi:predicted HAD superfamily Cof-like phosphohydrolase
MSMESWQQDIYDLHKALEHPAPGAVDVTQVRHALRASLIAEEASELIAALGCKAGPDGTMVFSGHADWPEVIDGAVDLIVVTLGLMVEMGVDIDPFWTEVHRTNMAKKDGPIREDGKRLKPSGWEPPRIKAMWEALLIKATRQDKSK